MNTITVQGKLLAFFSQKIYGCHTRKTQEVIMADFPQAGVHGFWGLELERDNDGHQIVSGAGVTFIWIPDRPWIIVAKHLVANCYLGIVGISGIIGLERILATNEDTIKWIESLLRNHSDLEPQDVTRHANTLLSQLQEIIKAYPPNRT
ncbi:hypothetical protein H6758_01360 [Candidatus Nomurabacteria bacterium]|nr:hypothetical protein [Candidatus Nomurabacteria bacterium]